MNFALRRALFSSAILPAAAVAAQAADLPIRKAPVAPPAVMAAMWDGSYFGVKVGYAWTQSNSVVTQGFPGFDATPGSARIAAALATTSLQVGNGGGFAGGVQAGYNKQFDPSSSAGNPTSRVSPPAASRRAPSARPSIPAPARR